MIPGSQALGMTKKTAVTTPSNLDGEYRGCGKVVKKKLPSNYKMLW